MFNEDELKVYDKKFQAIGILDKEEQKKDTGVLLYIRCYYV